MSKVQSDKFEMRLGLPGSGKTLTQTELIVLPALLEGLDVYVNYWVNCNLENYHYFSDFDEIKNVRNCLVVFDEMCKVLDPRDWEKEGSVVRDFFQLHRHRHIEIYGNTQHISFVAKTALAEVSQFFMCDREFDGFLSSVIPFFPVVIRETPMSLKEIKLEEAGYIMRDDDVEEFSVGKSQSYWFRQKKLQHHELDNIKQELIHWHCSKCNQRHLNQIPANQTEVIAQKTRRGWVVRPDVEIPNCPKHKNHPLEIKESAIYDTDYEFITVEKDVYFKPFTKALKEVPYRGRLTDTQLEYQKNLEQRYNG